MGAGVHTGCEGCTQTRCAARCRAGSRSLPRRCRGPPHHPASPASVAMATHTHTRARAAGERHAVSPRNVRTNPVRIACGCGARCGGGQVGARRGKSHGKARETQQPNEVVSDTVKVGARVAGGTRTGTRQARTPTMRARARTCASPRRHARAGSAVCSRTAACLARAAAHCPSRSFSTPPRRVFGRRQACRAHSSAHGRRGGAGQHYSRRSICTRARCPEEPPGRPR